MYYQFQAPVLSIRVDSIIGGIRGDERERKCRHFWNGEWEEVGNDRKEKGRTVGAGIGRDI